MFRSAFGDWRNATTLIGSRWGSTTVCWRVAGRFFRHHHVRRAFRRTSGHQSALRRPIEHGSFWANEDRRLV